MMERFLTGATTFEKAGFAATEDAHKFHLWEKATLAGMCAYLLKALHDASPGEATIACSFIIDADENGEHLSEWVQEQLAKSDGPEQTDAGAYLVWSNEAQQWWGPNGRGYTHRIFSAGRYTHDDAVEACNRRTWSIGAIPPEVMIPAPPAALLDAMQAVHDSMPERIQAATVERIASREAATVSAQAEAGQ